MTDTRSSLGWIALAAAAVVASVWLFPRAHPLFPDDWRIAKREAEAIAVEMAADLGPLPPRPFLTTLIHSDPIVEHRLLEQLRVRPRSEVVDSGLAQAVTVWEVQIHDADAPASDWSYRVRIAPRGQLLELRRRVGPQDGGGEIDLEEARRRADRFLADQGFDLERYAPPEVRSQQLQSRTDLALRYRDREALLGEERPYGIEVGFAGSELTGFSGFLDDPGRTEIRQLFQPVILLQQGWLFVVLLLLPVVAVPFVRRYHAGEIGVRRGLEIGLAVFASGVLVVAFTARAAAAEWPLGLLTKPQITLVVACQLTMLFFLPLALLSVLSWAVGESLCRERAGDRLASFDALLKGDWVNATFAREALRGTAAGLAVVALSKLLLVGLHQLGARSYNIFLLGPWWENAAWFSIPLVLFALGYALYTGMFGQLLLVSAGRRVLGRRLGTLAAIFAGALLFFPVAVVFPLPWSLPLWLLPPAVGVALFLRYGIFSAVLAGLTGFVFGGALPFLLGGEPSMQLQAGLALLIVALPLVLSARQLAGGREFVYHYDDIPPHVRRIAERERQKVELETARRIQTSILPSLPPRLLGVEMAHAYLPATEVGGDFYDVLALEDGRLAVAVGDVAGHGVSSGLVMSMAKSALAVQVTFNPEVEAVFGTLNRMVYQSARKRLLTTLCYALIDPRERQLRYASAGHLFPYRIGGDGRVEALESVSYPLGVRESLVVRERQTRLEAGELLFLFSDGVVEARPHDNDEAFGFERLETSLARHAAAGVGGLRDGVLGDLDEYTGGGPRDDDLTLLVLAIP